MDGVDEFSDLEGLNFIISLDSEDTNLVDILNTGLEFRDVFNGGELNEVNTTVNEGDDNIVVSIDTIFEEVFNGHSTIL